MLYPILHFILDPDLYPILYAILCPVLYTILQPMLYPILPGGWEADLINNQIPGIFSSVGTRYEYIRVDRLDCQSGWFKKSKGGEGNQRGRE